MTNSDIQKKLFEMSDLKYKEFQCRLMPTVDSDKVIGVRTPQLRKFAAQIGKTGERDTFLDDLPHYYYDENNLHGFLIEGISDYDECIRRICGFLPYVDNWATCDLMRPKVFKKHTDRLIEDIKQWLKSEQVYTVRFGLEMLMSYYLDEHFKNEYLDMAASAPCNDYYLSMMKAWYFATALAKQYEATLPYLENWQLDDITHNRTIQKAVESYRISDEQKAYLRTLRIKKHSARQN